MAGENVISCEDRAGNHFQLFQINHTNGSSTSIVKVDQSAVAVAHVPTSGQTAVTATLTTESGDAANGVKTATVPSGSATGAYTVCVRHTGSAAGVGSSKISV